MPCMTVAAMRSASTNRGGKVWDAASARSFKARAGMALVGLRASGEEMFLPFNDGLNGFALGAGGKVQRHAMFEYGADEFGHIIN